MATFLASLFGGQNKTLDTDINNLGSLAQYSTGVGETDTTAASKFYTDILSGNPTTEASAIAPEISAAQKQAQQAKNQTAQFGDRGGGTNATTQNIDTGTRTDVLNTLGGLKTSAASGAAGIGATNLGMASNDTEAQAKEAQQRFENWKNSILGQGITTAVGTAEGVALG